MRSYGDKPQSFLSKVPGGLLPVIELDGRVQTESVDIMMLLEEVRPCPFRLLAACFMRLGLACSLFYTSQLPAAESETLKCSTL